MKLKSLVMILYQFTVVMYVLMLGFHIGRGNNIWVTIYGSLLPFVLYIDGMVLKEFYRG